MEPTETGMRKADHVRIVLEEDVAFDVTTTGFEDYRLLHCALPEFDLDAVETETSFLGRRLAFPMIISSMTGGTFRGGQLNRILAEAAQAAGVGMGLGSTRIVLEQPEVVKTFQVRDVAPDILLFANLGAVQFNYGYGAEDCRRLIELTQADALYLHLNPLQEALQPGGDTRYDNLLKKIERVCRALPVPVVIKEVGWGISAQVAKQLAGAGVAGLDIAGAGGTSWSQVEAYRHSNPVEREIALSFRDWGIPTVDSLRAVRSVAPDLPLIASGGVRSGIDIAKSIALGADVTATATPLLHAAAASFETLCQRLEIYRRQLQIAMFVTGSRTVRELRNADILHIEDRRLP